MLPEVTNILRLSRGSILSRPSLLCPHCPLKPSRALYISITSSDSLATSLYLLLGVRVYPLWQYFDDFTYIFSYEACSLLNDLLFQEREIKRQQFKLFKMKTSWNFKWNQVKSWDIARTYLALFKFNGTLLEQYCVIVRTLGNYSKTLVWTLSKEGGRGQG